MITVRQFAEWLLQLPEGDQGKELHCVMLCGGMSVIVQNLQVRTHPGNQNMLCIDDDGDPTEGT